MTVGAPMAQAARAVTTTVPIVMATSKDPETQGLVQNLAQPGGNITGLSTSVGWELEAKRLALLEKCYPASLASPTSVAGRTKTGKNHGERVCGWRQSP